MKQYETLVGKPVHVRQLVLLDRGQKVFHFNGLFLDEDETHICINDIKQGKKSIPKFGSELNRLTEFEWNFIVNKHANTVANMINEHNEKSISLLDVMKEKLRTLDEKIQKLEKERDQRFEQRLNAIKK